jgi:ABC-type glycerol-3-phosphate transport system permease component
VSTRGEALQTAPAVAPRRLLIGTLLFLAVFAVGLYIVKWSPYWHKTHVAAVTHSIGSSIVSGKSSTAPPVGIAAAWSYALAYYKAIWQAFVLALILGAAVPVLVPRRWLHRLIGDPSLRATALAGGLSLAGMM